VATARDALDRDPADVRAWAQLAMMLGDTGAAPLGLWVALHADRTAPDPAARARIGGHLALFLLDLRLGADSPDKPGHVRILPALEAWLDRELAPFAGSLPRAARWVLALAAARTGASPGPDPAL